MTHTTARRPYKAAAIALLLGLVFNLFSLPVRAAEPADIYNQIPSNANIFVVVPKLSAASKTIGGIAAKFGAMNPEIANLLETAQKELGIEKGLNKDAGGAMVLTGLPLGAGQPPMLMILPVTDYDAFLSNFKDVKADGDVSSFTSEKAPEELHAKKSGAYAVLSNNKLLVQNYKAAAPGAMTKAAGVTGRDNLTRSDVVIGVNMQLVGPVLQPIVAGFIAQGMQAFEQQAAGAPAELKEQMETVKAMMGMYAIAINNYLRDASITLVGISASDKGFGFTFSTQFKGDSELGKTFSAEPESSVKLDRLPGKPYLMTASLDISPQRLAELSKAMAAVMPANSREKIMASYDEYFKAAGSVTQFAILMPKSGKFESLMSNMIAVNDSKNPEALRKAAISMYRSMNGLAQGNMKYVATIKPDARQVDGKSIDDVSFKIDAPEESPEAMILQKIYGEKMTMNISIASTTKSMVMSMGNDDATFAEALAAADGGGKLDANAGIVSARKHLPANRVAEMFVDTGNILKLVNSTLGGEGDNAPAVPAGTEPLAATLSVHSGGMSAHLSVPMGLVELFHKMAGQLLENFGGPAAPIFQ